MAICCVLCVCQCCHWIKCGTDSVPMMFQTVSLLLFHPGMDLLMDPVTASSVDYCRRIVAVHPPSLPPPTNEGAHWRFQCQGEKINEIPRYIGLYRVPIYGLNDLTTG